ncbi:MAG TPA: hypothetical protein VM261_03850 [Kofleriaceae bacterium]|nr:hypothetical protein [Kofleriaceae bacterium]
MIIASSVADEGSVTWRSAFLAALLAVPVALTGCGGPSCEDAVDNAMKVYGFGGASYGSQRASAIKKCKDNSWSEPLRACVKNASSRNAVDECERLATKGKSSVEAYDDYMKKSKRSEAELNLNALQKSLKVTFIENAEFPRGTAPLTPATPCCEHSPDRKCPVSVSEWADNPVWSALDFELVEPSLFQYSYESTDGKVAIVKAVGDLDCDTTTSEYVLRCEAPDGNPSCTVTKPDRAD